MAAASSNSLPTILPANLFTGVSVCKGPKASLNALPTIFGLVTASTNTPFAAENPVAEKKFLKCVTGDKIVFAICAPALGASNKFLYKKLKPLMATFSLSASNKNLKAFCESPRAAAIDLDVYSPCNGLTA